MPGGRLKREQLQRDLEAQLSSKITKRGAPVAQEGIIVAGSWNAADATVEVIFCDTYAVQADDSDVTPVNHARVPVWSTQYQDLYAPVGNERVHLIPTQSGWAAILQHNEDDSLPVPSGERWICHRNAQGEIDAFIKHTNDGPTVNDGLGGAYYGGNAALTQSTTKGGHVVELNDTTQKVTVAANTPTSSGKVYTIYDPVGNVLANIPASVSHVGPGIALGDLYQNLSKVENAATRFSDLDSAIKDQITQLIGNSHIQLLTAIIANGGLPSSGSAEAVLAALQSGGFPSPSSFFKLLPSLNGIVTPACSAITLIK